MSTWNYMSVHLHGNIRFMSNEELVQFMRKFTLKFEGGNEDSPTIYDNLPASYTDKMMPAIVGFELKADTIENVFKLSQNKDEKTYRNIISNLKAQGGNASLVAEEMVNRTNKVFPKN